MSSTEDTSTEDTSTEDRHHATYSTVPLNCVLLVTTVTVTRSLQSSRSSVGISVSKNRDGSLWG